MSGWIQLTCEHCGAALGTIYGPSEDHELSVSVKCPKGGLDGTECMREMREDPIKEDGEDYIQGFSGAQL